MKTIWKYPFSIVPTTYVTVQYGAKIIHVGLDPEGQPCIWCEVNTLEAKREESIELFIVGTGHGLPSKALVHRGSFDDEHSCMWHVYSR